MARRLYQQPNGLYAEYSTVVDAFVATDMTKEDIIELRRKEAADEAERLVRSTLQQLDSGVVYIGRLSWDQAVANHNKNCTPEERIQV